MLRLIFGTLLLVAQTSSCKGGDSSTPPPQVDLPKGEKSVTKPEIVADPAAIDADLATLAVATIKAGLPRPKGQGGIACGDDESLQNGLKKVGALLASVGKSYAAADLCIMWNPYKPEPVIAWMISAGEIPEGEVAMSIRRCLRLAADADGKVTQGTVIDGPCL